MTKAESWALSAIQRRDINELHMIEKKTFESLAKKFDSTTWCKINR